jgi:hypothetical protein
MGAIGGIVHAFNESKWERHDQIDNHVEHHNSHNRIGDEGSHNDSSSRTVREGDQHLTLRSGRQSRQQGEHPEGGHSGQKQVAPTDAPRQLTSGQRGQTVNGEFRVVPTERAGQQHPSQPVIVNDHIRRVPRR